MNVPYFKNTSQYPSSEVKWLVEFALDGMDTSDIAITVKNTRHTYRGMAYRGIPNISPARHSGARNLITIGIGGPGNFPTDTARDVVRWRKISREEFHAAIARGDRDVSHRWRHNGHDYPHPSGDIFERRHVTREGYGGKKSPIIQVRDWRECLVMVAAHEARHIHQFRNKLRASEIDCERFAAAAVERYRKGV